MVSRLIGVALVTLLFAGPAALPLMAQSTGTTPPATAEAKPAPKMQAPKHHARRKHMVKKAPAQEEMAPVTGVAYPPCSKTVKDQCIQLWQRNLSTVYPQCAKVRGSEARAACIETAYKQSKS